MWGLLVWLHRAIIRQVTHFTIAETLVGSARGTGLHGSVVRHSLSWCLLATLLLGALIAILLLVHRTMLVWFVIPLIRWP